ncbi:MAG: CBS domain-containing protein [Bacteroidota bacterium]
MKTKEALGNIMTTVVKTVNPQDTMQTVHEIFQDARFHHLPVVNDQGILVGILSKADYYQLQDCFTIFRDPAHAESQNKRLFSSLLVEEVMTAQLAKLSPEDVAATALGYFQENRFRAIPIIDAAQRLLGIVTPLDLLNFAFKEETAPAS